MDAIDALEKVWRSRKRALSEITDQLKDLKRGENIKRVENAFEPWFAEHRFYGVYFGKFLTDVKMLYVLFRVDGVLYDLELTTKQRKVHKLECDGKNRNHDWVYDRLPSELKRLILQIISDYYKLEEIHKGINFLE